MENNSPINNEHKKKIHLNASKIACIVWDLEKLEDLEKYENDDSCESDSYKSDHKWCFDCLMAKDLHPDCSSDYSS